MRITPLLGEKGFDLIEGTDLVEGQYCAIVVVDDATFETLTGVKITVRGTLANFTFAAGFVLGGGFTQIKLSSGRVLAYRRE
jgi:hypothetical protein